MYGLAVNTFVATPKVHLWIQIVVQIYIDLILSNIFINRAKQNPTTFKGYPVISLNWTFCGPGHQSSTVKDNPQLSDLNGPGTSKLDWRYFEHNKVDRNELQIRKNLHKGTGTKITEKLHNLTEKYGSFCSCALCKFLRIWNSFLSTELCLKYLQSNFEVPGPLRSLGLVRGQPIQI